MADNAVSVVIPVYNRREQAASAARSALAQAGCEVEVVIVDDASPLTFALPPDLAGDARIRLMRSGVNGGPASARNIGIRAASHPWIAFLDSDDRFLPGKLARQLMLADSDAPLAVIATGFIYSRRAQGTEERLIPVEAHDVATFCAGCWYCPGSTALVHRTAFDAVGMFDERLRRLEDVDWFIRLALKGGSLKVVPYTLSWIDVDANATVQNVDYAAETIAAKYMDKIEPLLSPEERAMLAAYLALERAAARHKKARRSAAALNLLESLWWRPRATLHLKAWWRTASDACLQAGGDPNRAAHQGVQSAER